MRPMTQKDQLLNQIELLQELYQAIERIELLESQLKTANVLITSYAKEVSATRQPPQKDNMTDDNLRL